ncbi:MAG: amidohydrolase family protein [Chloroflexia bacterium]|nr:amidohydrolase family protein [Chloroflexia bacterium]
MAPPALSRRRFLLGLAAALAWIAGGCGRRPRPGDPAAVPTTAPTRAATPAATASFSPVPSGEAADLVLRGGKVITVDPADTIAQAVAVKNGLIQAVGTDADVAPYLGAATRIVELAGRALTPGLIDPHNHFQVMGQMSAFYVPFMPPEVHTIAELQEKLAEVVAQTPEGEWVKGYFLVVTEGRLPTRHDLDPVSPNHPVFILQQGGHYGSANSLALQMAGITADTPSPPGGLIEKGDDGEPTGVFYNHRAMDLLRRVIPFFTMEDVHQYILSTQPMFAAAGVTSFQDNNVRGVETVHTYMDVARAGQLYLRGAVYYTLEWPSDLERALHEMDRYSDDFIRFAGFKFLLDGQSHMAYCHEPHNGVRWDMPTWDPQTFKDAVRQLHDTGLQICVHCVGDAAVDLTLDAYEGAMDANPRPDPRHRIEHCILSTPRAIQRMADLGVVVSTQPQFLRLGGNLWAQTFGEERARRIMVTREWLDAGVPLALGSDAPTTPWYTPQVTLFGAVTRISGSNEFHEPDQALTIQEALRAHTMGAAYAGHQEQVKGSIEVGKLADLVVWNADPYTVPVKDLWTTTIDMTIVDGQIVYQV